MKKGAILIRKAMNGELHVRFSTCSKAFEKTQAKADGEEIIGFIPIDSRFPQLAVLNGFLLIENKKNPDFRHLLEFIKQVFLAGRNSA